MTYRMTPSQRSCSTIGILVIILAASVAYLPALRAGYVWDDDDYVTDNVELRSPDGLRRIWVEPTASPQYYPLVFTSFWIEYRLWGDDPRGYHATNVVLHLLNTFLFWAVLRRLAVPGTFLAAAIFALHPVHVESVAWISERKNVLAGVFSFSAVLAWLRWTATGRWHNYTLCLALFTGALLSKTIVCGLPLILLLLTWWQQPGRWRRALPWVAPLLALSAVLVGVTIWSEHRGRHIDIAPRELSLIARGLVAGRALGFYVGTLLWPRNLMAIYPLWEIDTRALWQYTFPAGALGVFTALWRGRSRLGRGPLVAVLSFAIALGPALGFVPFGFMRFSYVADHFQYPLASSSLIALGAAVVTTAIGHLGHALQRVAWTLAGGGLLLLGSLSWIHCGDYRNAETFWRANAARNPRAPKAHFSLGTQLARQSRQDEAVAHFTAAVELAPEYADAHSSLGLGLLHQGKLDEALSHFLAVLRLRPDSSDAHLNLGIALAQQGKPDEAIERYALALRLDPTNALAHVDWGITLEALGKLDEAVQHYSAALRIAPDHHAAQANLQRALARRAGRPSSG